MAISTHSMIHVPDEKASGNSCSNAFGMSVPDRFEIQPVVFLFMRSGESDFESEPAVNEEQITPGDLGDSDGKRLTASADGFGTGHQRVNIRRPMTLDFFDIEITESMFLFRLKTESTT